MPGTLNERPRFLPERAHMKCLTVAEKEKAQVSAAATQKTGGNLFMRFSMPRMRAFLVLLTAENTRTTNTGGIHAWFHRSVFFPCRKRHFGEAAPFPETTL